MSLIFAGTPDFARVSLDAMLAAGYLPAVVLTMPDRPAGRGRRVKPGPVKQLALQHGIPVWQPATLKDAAIVADLASLEPELLVVAAYGLLLPQAVLDIPARGCVNVHASLLPRWRGAAPVQAAILAGDHETGVTLMRMEAGLDSGPLIARVTTAIGPEETAGELGTRLAALGAELLLRKLPDILAGRTAAEAQDAQQATFTGKFRPQDARLDWREPAVSLARRVRAWNPVPGAWFELRGERIKCWSARATAGEAAAAAAAAPGSVLAADRHGIEVACGEGVLQLVELQRPGRRRCRAAELAGQLELAGARLE